MYVSIAEFSDFLSGFRGGSRRFLEEETLGIGDEVVVVVANLDFFPNWLLYRSSLLWMAAFRFGLIGDVVVDFTNGKDGPSVVLRTLTRFTSTIVPLSPIDIGSTYGS